MTHKTQRIEPSFSKWLEDLNFLVEMSQRIKTLLIIMTRRIDFLKNINQNKETFLMTHRIKLFFKKKKHDSQNWIIFSRWLTELNRFLFNMTQRIELFVEHDSNNWLSSIDWALFFQNDSRFCIRLKESNLFFLEYDPTNRTFFENIFKKIFSTIHRIELLFQHYLKNGTFESMGQRIELLLK